jgi:hypothetical protein
MCNLGFESFVSRLVKGGGHPDLKTVLVRGVCERCNDMYHLHVGLGLSFCSNSVFSFLKQWYVNVLFLTSSPNCVVKEFLLGLEFLLVRNVWVSIHMCRRKSVCFVSGFFFYRF